MRLCNLWHKNESYSITVPCGGFKSHYFWLPSWLILKILSFFKRRMWVSVIRDIFVIIEFVSLQIYRVGSNILLLYKQLSQPLFISVTIFSEFFFIQVTMSVFLKSFVCYEEKTGRCRSASSEGALVGHEKWSFYVCLCINNTIWLKMSFKKTPR